MLWEMSGEEIRERELVISELRSSRDPRKILTGIIMDTNVGHCGLVQENAEAKADEILKEFQLYVLN